ncbi:MAG: SBBP repeat-containing protein [Acidobacteria bacterium]|nr:SBBP repeat-containing protein [Acidobacteriota bacterium]
MRKISRIKRLAAMTLTASLIYTGVVLPGASAAGAESHAAVSPAANERAIENLGRTNVYFEENRGQFNSKARYFARGTSGYDLFLTDRDAVYVVRERNRTPTPTRKDPRAGIEELANRPPARAAAVYMSLVGANETSSTEGLAQLEHKTNYFKGAESNWRTDIPNYSEVRMNGLYDGIGAVWRGRESGGVQYDFVIQPNADPNQVEWNVTGADDVALDGDGNLIISTEFGAIRQNKPFTFQESEGVKTEIASAFVLEPKLADNGAKSFSVKFGVGEYDRTKPLTIDPSVNLSNLSFSTFLGGIDDETGYGIEVDAAGNIYVAGRTSSIGFPTTTGTFDTGANGDVDAFVVKMTAPGSSLIYSTFIGGTADDRLEGLTVDSSGNAFVTGGTSSANFPTTPGAFDTVFGGGSFDAFATKLNATGSALSYSTFIGGTSDDESYGITIDTGGDAFVVGYTASSNFPTTVGSFDTTFNGGFYDGFVLKLNPAGTSLSYSTFLGSSDIDLVTAVATDSSGNATVGGSTRSTSFPTTVGAFDTTHNGGLTDVFVTKLNPTASALTYSTYIGGNAEESTTGLALDSSGGAFICGQTTDGTVDYPTTVGAFDTTHSGTTYDGFVTKLNPSGSALSYSTFVSGTAGATPANLALDLSGNAVVTGGTFTGFPTTTGAYDTSNNGGQDAFVTKLNGTGSALIYSSFVGGAGIDNAYSVAIDKSGNILVTGETLSTSGFPSTSEVLQPQPNGGRDAFVTKLGDYSISGRAMDHNGGPIANAAVQMSGLQSGFMLSDAQGYYGFTDTASSGTTWVSATSALYNFTPSTYELFPGGNYVLQFVGRPISSGPTIAYGPVGGAVTSTAGNIGLPFTSLSIVDVHGNVRTTTTDAGGGYRFDNIRLGEMYVVYAERDGFNFEPSTAIVNLMTSDLNINFAARPAVSRPVQDFDGDGKTDLAVFRPSEGNWYIEESQTGRLRVVRFGTAGDIPIAEDFDGDRRADISVFRPSTGVWYRLNSSDGGFFAMNFGTNGDVPVPADFDGDGKTDIAVFRPSDGVWHRISSATGDYSAIQWGIASDRPVPADFDSDGRADLAVFRDGVWYRLNSSNGQPSIFQFGTAGDIPSAADFDGDGRPDTAVFRPADGTWHWLDNFDGEYHAVRYGLGTDKPIPADYNGDGRLEQAVYRGGIWYRLFPDGKSAASAFGLPTDIPITKMR